jgi:hypothetical protein
MSLEVARVLVEVGYASSLGERNGRGKCWSSYIVYAWSLLGFEHETLNRGAEVKCRKENEFLVSCVGMI